eukprot:TRINITY_DN2188_c0_g1_i1.p1 TRINITY_DN2188_c0_g1~~TRINITY_DN2188_c0_g1_i1.p1  ORF type:complete len:112 (+),score=5.26 TRINITY_DN2188_c0_g1_i1:577-912(+)
MMCAREMTFLITYDPSWHLLHPVVVTADDFSGTNNRANTTWSPPFPSAPTGLLVKWSSLYYPHDWFEQFPLAFSVCLGSTTLSSHHTHTLTHAHTLSRSQVPPSASRPLNL